jgi:hypothetical protein
MSGLVEALVVEVQPGGVAYADLATGNLNLEAAVAALVEGVELVDGETVERVDFRLGKY